MEYDLAPEPGPTSKEREYIAEIERLRHEVHELKRTRSEAEANVRVAGYREGAAGVVSQLRALSITVNTEPS